MSGHSPSEYKASTASNQQPASGGLPTSADSRLLDAAETLVTLQSVSSRGQAGVRTRGGNLNASGSEKSRAVYLTPHSPLSRPSRMAPQPPISATSSAMAPPTMPAQSGVTYVVINQGASNNSMKPPTEPPPKRGRGRGRGRGSSACTESRGRGRGRGRGAAASRAAIPPPSPIINDALEAEQEDIEMMDSDMGKESLPKEDTTFMVGNLELKDSIFDDLLNRKKLELLMDPEVMSLFANHQKTLRSSHTK